MRFVIQSNLDALEWALSLSKTDRTKLAAIKTKAELDSFIKYTGVTCVSSSYIKAVIPAIYKLQDFINKEVDNENNIDEIIRDASFGGKIKRLRNVSNFSQTMKNFYTAPFFICFNLGSDKCIAIRENENWNAPNKDIPIVPTNIINQIPFIDLINNVNEYIDNKIKVAYKIESDTVPVDIHNLYRNSISLSSFKFKFTQEQAREIFKSYYGFDPYYSNNNGLYVLILELKEKNFGGAPTPVHSISNVETDLNLAGIKKSNKTPEFKIKINGISGQTLNCSLYCEKFLFNFKITIYRDRITINNF
jgi:hypothetical protein